MVFVHDRNVGKTWRAGGEEGSRPDILPKNLLSSSLPNEISHGLSVTTTHQSNHRLDIRGGLHLRDLPRQKRGDAHIHYP